MTNVNVIPFQLPLAPVLPTIEGNVDYKVWRTRLLRIDQLLIQSGLENQMLQIDAQAWLAQGLKHRMEAPESFIGSINRLCIQMTHAWNKTDGQQRRKRTLRQMDRLVVRRKAGAEVEFGNTLFLAENPQGVILDWELFRQRAPADTDLLPRSLGRMQAAYGRGPAAVAADRGFDSQSNRTGLEAEGIYNALCPRAPQQLCPSRRKGGQSRWRPERPPLTFPKSFTTEAVSSSAAVFRPGTGKVSHGATDVFGILMCP